jgi:Domain of unknown function (DUF4403)
VPRGGLAIPPGVKLLPLALAATWVACAACARPLPLPAVPVPALSPRADALPELAHTTLSAQVAVATADVLGLAREQIALPSAPEFTQVSPQGDSPEIAVRYGSTLLAPSVANDGDALLLHVPVAYHGAFRVRARTPFGWVWLTKGTDWGTEAAPGRIDVTVRSRIAIADDWSVTSHSELASLELTAPPIAQLCTRGVIRVCVPASWAEERVHAELGRRIREELVPSLGRLDALARERIPLAPVLTHAWAELHRAHAAGRGAPSLRLAPEALQLTAPRVRGDQLALEVRLWLRPHEGEGGARAVVLPAPSHAAFPGDVLHARARIPFTELSEALAQQLARDPLGVAEGVRLAAVALLGAHAQPGRFVLGLTLTEEERSYTAYGDATLVPRGADLTVSELHLHTDSVRLLALVGLAPERLAQRVADGVTVDLAPWLEPRARAVADAITAALAPWPAAVRALRLTATGIYAQPEAVMVDFEGR